MSTRACACRLSIFEAAVRPSQAAKSRPLAKVSAGGARAAIAVAEIGPMPGTVISLRDTASSRARRAISLSRAAILPLRPASRSNINRNMARAASGSELAISSSSSRSASIVTCDGPLGAIQPYSVRWPPDRVDELGSLPHQQITGPKHQARRLLLFALHRHEPHAR